MKKSLIALAVLAASGASFAQSSVTIYGLADVWFGSVKTNDGSGTNKSVTQLSSGGVNTSRWGIKGSEDLGGGLKANFKLEQGFNIDTGTSGSSDGQTATQTFSRESYVGLSGGFGEVRLGKTWDAYDDVSGASDAMFDANALAPMKYVFKSTNYLSNPANQVYYATPTFGGFAGAVSYALAEDPRDGSSTAANAKVSVSAFNVTYGAGPVAAQLGYQVQHSNVNGQDDQKFTRLGGSYDFGVVVGKLTYGHVSNVGYVQGSDAREYQIGVDYPVTSALTLSASYAKSDDDNSNGVFEQKRKAYGIGAAYTLSKRTFLYTGYTFAKGTQEFADDETTKALAFGVEHKF